MACGQKPSKEPNSLKINHLQLIGSHNSYKLPIPPKIMEAIESSDPDLATSLDYSHPSVWEQLSMGLRLLELDVFRDPEGGRFSEPLGQAYMEEAVMDSARKAAFEQPGFKVFHVQDIDFRSHYPLLEDYLTELKTWSSLHPDHLPVFITVNAKDANYPERQMTAALPFGNNAFLELDELIRQVLGEEKLIIPKEIIGTHADLKTAIAESGWPDIQDLRGKFIWILDEKGEKLDAYLSRREGSREPLFFVNVPETHPMAGIHILNDPIGQQEAIKALVEKGYLVRTRADAETREARANDRKRMEAAFESGAQLISTDYYRPDPRFEGGYQVIFPDDSYQRINPFFSRDKKLSEVLEEPNDQVIALGPQTFQYASQREKPLLLDVRTQAEVDEGMITGAAHIDFMQADFSQRIEKLEKGQPVFVYCKVGGRSSKAAEQMREMGFEKVYHLEGGLDEWKALGLPVSR
ncbi:Ca2+-dependent phosphoinositide-specific phospholipase C [Cyclobacterium salsum]|uniref:Ca2+-dependent phosphoinositide-specific phospholipase C n=1 Tax=Cyclobacterium salsum TaxID=2666329 RepID=UPI001F41867F|nr:Ca2+-dependent phosphoinositide-specific phospholipase C [Cyclobacterium salsum]